MTNLNHSTLAQVVCMACLEGSMRAEGKSEYPLVSMDFCYTRGLEELEEIDKEYGGDVKGGLWLWL